MRGPRPRTWSVPDRADEPVALFHVVHVEHDLTYRAGRLSQRPFVHVVYAGSAPSRKCLKRSRRRRGPRQRKAWREQDGRGWRSSGGASTDSVGGPTGRSGTSGLLSISGGGVARHPSWPGACLGCAGVEHRGAAGGAAPRCGQGVAGAPGDRLEVPVGRFVIDLVRADGELVEVQTGGFSALGPKLDGLLDEYRFGSSIRWRPSGASSALTSTARSPPFAARQSTAVSSRCLTGWLRSPRF